jgi:hypothetical protein
MTDETRRTEAASECCPEAENAGQPTKEAACCCCGGLAVRVQPTQRGVKICVETDDPEVRARLQRKAERCRPARSPETDD